MRSKNEWEELIDAAAHLPALPTAHTFLRMWPSFSKPFAVSCDDTQRYVLKAMQDGRPDMNTAIVTEQFVGRIGIAIGAAVAATSLVHLPAGLVAAQPELATMLPGIAHATRYMEAASDRAAIDPPRNQQNSDAYAGLAVLYGWAHAGDHQLIRLLDGSDAVLSVDHGHFLPGGPAWSAATLDAAPRDWKPDPQFTAHVPASAVDAAVERVRLLADETLVAVAGTLRAAWPHVPLTDVAAIARFLAERRDAT